MINKDSIETAYSFFHQKWQVYRYSTIDTQKDDIEYAIAQYVEAMSRELYARLANGQPAFLLRHSTFASDMQRAISQLEQMMG